VLVFWIQQNNFEHLSTEVTAEVIFREKTAKSYTTEFSMQLPSSEVYLRAKRPKGASSVTETKGFPK
jgi:hypothetical protein